MEDILIVIEGGCFQGAYDRDGNIVDDHIELLDWDGDIGSARYRDPVQVATIINFFNKGPAREEAKSWFKERQ